MSSEHSLPVIYLARHGETEWSLSGQHTGLTDLPLTANGERSAVELGARLAKLNFAKVWTSPLQRASRTCALAGYQGEIDADLVEWDYGDYEGLRTAEIRKQRPDWQLFRDGCPGGETPEQARARAERVVDRLRAVEGSALVFSSGHFTRVIAAVWAGLDPVTTCGALLLSTASLSAIGYQHDRTQPVIRLWNDTSHFGPAK